MRGIRAGVRPVTGGGLERDKRDAGLEYSRHPLPKRTLGKAEFFVPSRRLWAKSYLAQALKILSPPADTNTVIP